MGAQQRPQAGSEVRGHKFLKFTGEKNPKKPQEQRHKPNSRSVTCEWNENTLL